MWLSGGITDQTAGRGCAKVLGQVCGDHNWGSARRSPWLLHIKQGSDRKWGHRDEEGSQIMQTPVALGQIFGFYSEWDGKSPASLSDMLDTHLRMIILTTMLRNFGWQGWKQEPSPGKGDAGRGQDGAVETVDGGWILDALWMWSCQKLLMNWMWRNEKKEKCQGGLSESSSLSPELLQRQSCCLLKWEGCGKSRAQEREAVKTLLI